MRARQRVAFALALISGLAACASIAPQPAVAPHPFDAQFIAAAEAIASEHAVADRFAGVVVLARGEDILLAKAHGFADRGAQRENTPLTPFNIASLGKMFTGVAIARLVERGVLDYDAPVGRYLGDFPNADIAGKVTLHHLLSHTSGIPDLPDALFTAPPAKLDGYLPYFAQARLEFEPGAQRAYSNAGFVLLGLVLESATGRSYEDVLRAEVFAPAGMQSIGFRRQGTPGAATGYTRKADTDAWQANTAAIAPISGPHGGQLATAQDLVHFFAALRDGRLLRKDTAEAMINPRHGAASAYAFGTLDFATDRLVGHSGGDAGASADAYTYWNSGYTIVVLSNLDPPASHDVARALRKLLEPRFEATDSDP